MLRSMWATAAAAGSLFLLVASTAQAEWLPTKTLAEGRFRAPAVALEDSGDAAIAVRENRSPSRRGDPSQETSFLATRPGAAGAFTRTAVESAPLLGGHASGMTAAMPRPDGGVVGAFRPAGGAFTGFAPVLSADAGVFAHYLATSAGGAAAVVRTTINRISVAVRPAGGVFGPEQHFAIRAGRVGIAVADDGAAIIVTDPREDADLRVLVREPGATGRWTDDRTLQSAAGGAPRVAMNRRGDALVTFADAAERHHAAYRPASGPFRPSADLGPTGRNYDDFLTPLPVVGDDGSAFAVKAMHVDDATAPYRLDVIPVGPAGAGTPVSLGKGPVPFDDADGAIDAAGHAWVTWSTGTSDAGELWAARAERGVAFAAPVRLASALPDYAGHAFAGDRRGGALVAWSTGDALRYAEWPAPPKPQTPPGGGGGGGGGGGQDGGRPGEDRAPRAIDPVPTVLRDLKVARRGTRLTVSFTVSAPTRVTLAVQRAGKGRKVGRSCVKAARRHRRRPACTRWTAVGRPTARPVTAGAQRVTLTLPRRAAAGRYRVAAALPGERAATAAFTVPRARR